MAEDRSNDEEFWLFGYGYECGLHSRGNNDLIVT